MKRSISTILSLLLFATAVAGQAAPTTPGEFMKRVQGNWAGKGTFSKMPAESFAIWEPVLDGKFVRLTVRLEIAAPGSARIFAGHGYYQTKAPGEFEGYWFDSEGHQYPIKASVSGDVLTAFWGIPGRVEGKSEYTLSDSDRGFEIVDSFKTKDGSWRELNRFKLKRK